MNHRQIERLLNKGRKNRIKQLENVPFLAFAYYLFAIQNIGSTNLSETYLLLK